MNKKALITKLTFLCSGFMFFISCSDMFSFQTGESSSRNTSETDRIIFNGTISVSGALPVSLNETLNQVQGDSHAELDSASLAQEIPCQARNDSHAELVSASFAQEIPCQARNDNISARNDSSVSRSALPSFTIGTEYYYYVTATQTDGSGSFTINSIEDSDFFDFSSGVTFALELTSGKWNIEAGIKNDDASVMSETYPATVSTANPVVSHTFYPKLSQKGRGTLSLNMSIPDTVKSLTATCSDDGWNVTCGLTSESLAYVKGGDGTDGATVDSGSYEVTFNFYDEDSILLYSTVQTVNVFDNLLTNTWVSDGSGIINESGDFSLTSALITQFARTTLYVGQTAAATKLKITANDTSGTGSVYSPLKTLDVAIKKIIASGDGTKDYKIFISGEVTGNSSLTPPVASKARSISICGLNGLDEQGNPKDALIGDGSDTVLNVMTSASLKDIVIKGGTTGLSVGLTGTTVTIESGVLITGCSRGVNIYGSGKLKMKGGKISGNTGTQGGGVKLSSGAGFDFEDGEISGNEAVVDPEDSYSGEGGGVYVESGCSFTMTGGTIKSNKAVRGAGIYNSASSSSITDGTITENEASEQGGGICNTSNSSFTITGGEISKNTSPSGGAILVNYATLVLSDDAYIPSGDKKGKHGAGKNDICLEKNGSHDSYITVADGLLKHTESAPVAVSLDELKRGKTVIIAQDGVLETLPDDIEKKFVLTSAADGWESFLSSDKKSLRLNLPIYVAGKDYKKCSANGSDDEGTGLKSAPFATISKALSLMNDKDVDYIVAIDGEVPGAQTIPSTLKNDGNGTYNARSVVICGATGNTTDILNGGFTQTSNGTTLKILTGVPVIIKKIKITGGYAASSSAGGGGLYVNGDVTLSEGALVYGNYTASCGGGIYNDSKNLTIESGAEISGNHEKGVSNCGGGGVFNYKGTLVISGGVIKTNSAAHEGGAIYNDEEGTCYIYGNALIGKDATAAPSEWNYGSNTAENGGAICVKGGNVYIGYKNNNGTASKDDEASVKIMGNAVNSSSSKGGGIYVVSGTVQIAKTCVGFNYSPKDGGGIYTTGTVSLLEDAVIKGNKAYSYGGGVHVNKKGSLSMTSNSIIGGSESGEENTAASGGGVYVASNSTVTGDEATVTFGVLGASVSPSITGNSATSGGGGVYVENFAATFNMHSGTISNNKLVGGTTGGGGVEISYGTFNMNGGTISGNYIENPGTSTLGGAVDINTNGTFNIKGTVSIPYGGEKYKNDVSSRGNPVKIAGAITLPEGVSSVATIIPKNYTEPILELETSPTPSTTLANEAGKFEVVPNGSTKYYIAFDGKMYKYKPAAQFTAVPASGDTTGLATMDDFEKVAEWVDDGNELTGVTLILLTDVTLDSSFTPVGEYYSDYEVNKQGKVRKVFTGGTFDGNNKTITYDNVSFTQEYSGIFSGAKNATIQNLNLEGTLNVNADYAGCVIGHAEACIVKNCSSSVTITSESSQYGIGGIIGDAEGTSVSGKTYYNERDCYILDCVNTGSITGSASGYVGGIAGSATACIIRNCINKGNITGAKCCGGIVGVTSGSGPNSYGNLIENCGNNGNVSVTGSESYDSGAGGIAGGPSANNDDWYPHINNCYSSGTITCTYTTYDGKTLNGGILGYEKDKCVLSKCYYYNPNQACSAGSPSGSSKYTSISNILDDMNSLNNSDSATYRKWKVSGIVLEFE
ncbi:hypothetical protein HNP77_002350 [Treponema rectale]|uniref:Polymorphic outer membrane protein repeat-containing protein n=1 Tax=Treponema rectale TaxID=744512 RepID=A0A840SKS9_9SPIR|nr:hypothetical protein [Treponema rectale]MBB5219961.1 hypothetical protein [Treponema rectale]